MADSLLDNYNPLYDIHLRQYFALPHMQKHLQKMGLLESTLNLNGDEVYARHHAMMDMMLKNREAQLLKMAELRKKLDAAEKVECCRRIRTGQSPESYRQGKPSRSLSRNRAGQKNGSVGRQRRYSNSFEDRDFVQRIEERNSDPVEQNTRDPYKRLSANAKRFNYLHKLDDNTLIAYKDNLQKQLQRLERFREISFGPHSVARQAPPPQASWFFRRRSLPSLTASAPGNTLKEPLRSVLNMRGRKATTGNKLNASHDNRTSCPPIARKRKDSNTRLPPINPQKNRVSTKPPAPVSLQQISTKLPPAAKKPAPTRGRPSNKRQTTTTTTIQAVSKSPPISNTTLPVLPHVTGHGIFTGAAAAATAAAIGTAAINIDELIDKEPTPPRSPVLETQKTFDRSSPTTGVDEEVPSKVLDDLADESEKVTEQEEQEFVSSQIVFDNTPVDHRHGDYEDSDSEPEYAEEDRETTDGSPTEPLAHHVHNEKNHSTPPVSDLTHESPHELNHQEDFSPKLPSPDNVARSPPTLIFTEQSTEDDAQSPVDSGHQTQQSPVVDVHSTHVVEHFDTQDATPQSPVLSIHDEADYQEKEENYHSPVMSVHDAPPSPNVLKHQSRPLSPAQSIQEIKEQFEPALVSPTQSIHSSHTSEHQEFAAQQSPARLDYHEATTENSVTSIHGSHHLEHHEIISSSPVFSIHSSHASEHPVFAAPLSTAEHHETAPEYLVASIDSSNQPEHYEYAAPQSPISSENREDVPENPIQSINNSQPSEQREGAAGSPMASIHSSHHLEHAEADALQSPVASEHFEAASVSPVQSIHSSHALEHHEFVTPQSPVNSDPDQHADPEHSPPPQSPSDKDALELSPSIYSSQASEQFEQQQHSPPVSEKNARSARSTTVESSVTMQESYASEETTRRSPVTSDDQIHAHASPVASEKDVGFERAPSVHSSQGSDRDFEHVDPMQESYHQDAPVSPVASEKDGFERASSVYSEEHLEQHHEPTPRSPVASEKETETERAVSVHSETLQSPRASEHVVPQSPVLSVHNLEDAEHQNGLQSPESHVEHVHFQQPKSEIISKNDPYASHNMDHEAVPDSPVAADSETNFAPRSPSVHTSDAEEETFEIQHHSALTHSQPAAPRSPTEADLYNPTREDQGSPVMSDFEENSAGVPIADRIDLEAYHDSPTKESTSPVIVNPIQVQVNAEEVVKQLTTPEQNQHVEDIINKSADEEASHLIQEALTEAPAIIDMVNTYEEKEKFSESESHDKTSVSDAMMASMYQPLSDQDQESDEREDHHEVYKTAPPTLSTKEWDEGNQHVKEFTTYSEYTDGNTTMSFQETITTATDNEHGAHSPDHVDNISTDSLIIHDEDLQQDSQMTQSIYQPHEGEGTDEKEWDEGNKHIHETISEHTDESGTHFTETVTTTTTVIKSGDDSKNNNDDEEDRRDNDEEKTIEEEDEHGSNGNLVREAVTTTTHTATSGLPEGGILVDDGDETNISSL